jgi:hypothetical protein
MDKYCSSCQTEKDSTGGKTVPTANGKTRWKCEACVEKKGSKPGRKAKPRDEPDNPAADDWSAVNGHLQSIGWKADHDLP